MATFCKKYLIIVISVSILSFMCFTLFSNQVSDIDKIHRSTLWIPQMAKHNIFKRSLTRNRKSMIQNIHKQLQEALKNDKGKGCQRPKMNPFDMEVTQFDIFQPNIVCHGMDWVRCELSRCKVRKKILKMFGDVVCTYRDLIYDSDKNSHFGKKVVLKGNAVYTLVKSDHAEVTCYSQKDVTAKWFGYVIGFRKIDQKPSPPGRENILNVLIFGFDSTSKNGFIRRMPLSYKMLREDLNAVILNGYNIVGDGTPHALFPILTGKTEMELPDVRIGLSRTFLDTMPWIFYKLKDDGYRTAYFEDEPHIGTFQLRLNGWNEQPTDHYSRHFFKQVGKLKNREPYCIGDTPSYGLMMNITKDFFKLIGKKFCFTFIVDITHDFNRIQTADEDLVMFLKYLKKNRIFEDTLFILMSDHGPRFANVRSTYLGKLEERHPLMAFVVPENLKKLRPKAINALKKNVEVLTTPHDIYATLLDVIEMREQWNSYKVPGADLTRGISLLEPIPMNRSCSEAAVEPHWCTCVQWHKISRHDPMFKKSAQMVVDYINQHTAEVTSSCVPRILISVEYVMKQQANSQLLKFKTSKDRKGMETRINREEYTVKFVVGPREGVFEASFSYLRKEDTPIINTRDIQRINAYGNESSCIQQKYPHLIMFCYCRN